VAEAGTNTTSELDLIIEAQESEAIALTSANP